MSPEIEIRPAQPGDETAIWGLINELAEFEKLTHQLTGSAEALREHLFGERPYAHALIAERDGAVLGYALFFNTYSTFRTQPGVWMEDLYVTPNERGKGIGKALLLVVSQLTLANGWGRHEWAVLDWNQSAIDFYQALGAQLMPDWRICRLEDATLGALAERM